MNRCETCAWWKGDLYEGGRECTNGKIREDKYGKCYEPDALVYSYYESGSFWTGPQFGCVHHMTADREPVATHSADAPPPLPQAKPCTCANYCLVKSGGKFMGSVICRGLTGEDPGSHLRLRPRA
jgi:hypothetical protein